MDVFDLRILLERELSDTILENDEEIENDSNEYEDSTLEKAHSAYRNTILKSQTSRENVGPDFRTGDEWKALLESTKYADKRFTEFESNILRIADDLDRPQYSSKRVSAPQILPYRSSDNCQHNFSPSIGDDSDIKAVVALLMESLVISIELTAPAYRNSAIYNNSVAVVEQLTLPQLIFDDNDLDAISSPMDDSSHRDMNTPIIPRITPINIEVSTKSEVDDNIQIEFDSVKDGIATENESAHDIAMGKKIVLQNKRMQLQEQIRIAEFYNAAVSPHSFVLWLCTVLYYIFLNLLYNV